MLPIIVTLPATVAERLADVPRETPLESVPVPHDVPLTVIDPDVVVTRLEVTQTPNALFVPFAAVPLIVTWPAPVAEMLADDLR